jgi:GNAT superfamily N-acetyltransferase
VAEPLLDNPRSFAANVAAVLGGMAIERAGLAGFVSSEFDPFLNHLFAEATVTPRQVADVLDGRPGFVWLAENPAPHELEAAGAESLQFVEMYGMSAATAQPLATAQINREIVEVRTQSELRAWHEIYCEVFGVDNRGRPDWQAVHDAHRPTGDDSLLLLLARIDDSPAATGGVYLEPHVAGLYCFTTRERMRRRGLGSALVHASHTAARARGCGARQCPRGSPRLPHHECDVAIRRRSGGRCHELRAGRTRLRPVDCLDLGAEPRQIVASRGEHAAVELDDDRAAGAQPIGASAKQSPVGL